MGEIKRCTKCGLNKEVALFPRNKNGSDGLHCWCKACNRIWKQKNPEKAREKYRLWAKKNSEKRKEYHKRWLFGTRYNITTEEYDTMFRTQGGLCAICGRTGTAKRKLAVDHDHKTGKVRGLLCAGCNGAIGLLEDSIIRARAVATYLERHGAAGE